MIAKEKVPRSKVTFPKIYCVLNIIPHGNRFSKRNDNKKNTPKRAGAFPNIPQLLLYLTKLIIQNNIQKAL